MHIQNCSRTAGRTRLLVTSAIALTAVSQPALANDAGLIDAVAPEAHGAGLTSLALPEPQLSAVLEAVAPEAQAPNLVQVGAPDPSILIANPGTTVTSRDTGVTGVGQMIVDSGGGFIGLCTGTLINPRTVILAAHCVNTRPATDYGANSGGTGIAFGFEAYTRANAPGETDELVRWLRGGTGGAGQFQTNTAQSFYNANFVAYNPYSLEPEARSFLYGDVAMATLDTPAANVPTWALLFSPLPNPGSITAGGTGYNVKIVGYGGIGTGQAGQTASSDYRRRAAENMIGALTDLETFEGFLFGGAPNGLKQNLYFMDFDDPRRGVSGASPFDFNAFRDNARFNGSTPTEGITAPGDSGGPLIVQNFAKQVVAGVLSGGYSRFFNGQLPYSYGAVSFYQPLYLYWDWIAANNPYHYVSAKAGDGSWTDPGRWVTTLDPAYNILSGGSLVNGLPTVAGEQKNGTSGDFGQICFQTNSLSDCYDTATGVETITGGPIGTASNNAGSATIRSISDGQGVSDAGFGEVVLESQQGALATAVLPAATLANGLPGATNFVPNNVDPVRTTGKAGQYYDVTLSAAGTTTLSGANVTIDRLTIGTAAAGLNIASGASLTTLMGTNQFAGTVTVNGTLTSVGDYSLLGGAMLGSGRINAPFLTSVLGQFAPGTTTTTGTLTVGGNLVMASGTNYFVNLAGAGVSDRIAVVANGSSIGAANLGGSLAISPAAGSTVRYADVYTILTAAGGVTGTFTNPGSLSAILRPTVLYSTNAVQLRIDAGTYASVIDTTSPVQRAYAALLDANRAAGKIPDVYGVLDMQDAATIRTTLDALAPRSETLRSALATMTIDNNSRLIRQRLAALGPNSGNGGTIAYYGRPAQTASLVQNRMRGNLGIPAVGSLAGYAADNGGPAATEEGKLPETMSAFFAGGYLDGESRPMQFARPASGNDQFDGWYIAAGIEAELSDNGQFGLALSYTDVDGQTAGAPGGASGSLIQATLYSKYNWGKVSLSTQTSVGKFHSKTSRPGNLPGASFTLRSIDDALTLASELKLGLNMGTASFDIVPNAAVRGSWIDFGRSLETGGPTAMVFDRPDFRSIQGRLGLDLAGKGKIRPFLSGSFVHDFRTNPYLYNGTFAGALPGPMVTYNLAGQDRNWAEVSGGLSIDTGRIGLSLSADTTIGRDDVKNQAYRAAISLRF